jgi:hypothetical protein
MMASADPVMSRLIKVALNWQQSFSVWFQVLFALKGFRQVLSVGALVVFPKQA